MPKNMRTCPKCGGLQPTESREYLAGTVCKHLEFCAEHCRDNGGRTVGALALEELATLRAKVEELETEANRNTAELVSVLGANKALRADNKLLRGLLDEVREAIRTPSTYEDQIGRITSVVRKYIFQNA